MNELGERNTKREIINFIKTVVIAVFCGIIINSTILASAHVISGSMEDTVMTHSRVMGLRFIYFFSSPDRNDIILFDAPDGNSEHPYIKRIIGLPNEKLEIIDGKVYINDSFIPLEEDFVKGIPYGNYGPYYVPEDSYFVMGDNRNGSTDSRNWQNSFVPRKNIIARLYLEYFPSPQIFS